METKKTDNDPEVIRLFRGYQSSRSSDGVKEREKIMALLRDSKQSAEHISTELSSEYDPGEEQVQRVYEKYQQTRDPYRAEVSDRIMQVARGKTRERSAHQTVSEDAPATFKRLFTASGAVFDAIAKHLAGIFSRESRADWRLVVPALIVVVVVGLFVARVDQGDIDEFTSVKVAGVPAEMYQFAPQLAGVIRPRVNPALGFSQGTDEATVAFQLGVVAVDMLLLAHIGDKVQIANWLDRIRSVAPFSNETALQAELMALETVLKDDKPEVLPVRVNSLAEVLERYYASRSEEALFTLGKWIEVTYLACEIALKGENTQLIQKQLAMRSDVLTSDLSSQLSVASARLIEGLSAFPSSREPAYSEIRQLHKRLRHIKASME